MEQVKKNNVIAGYRVMTGRTQKDMAEMLKISPQSYNSKENGHRAFNDSEKKNVKSILSSELDGLTYEELFFS